MDTLPRTRWEFRKPPCGVDQFNLCIFPPPCDYGEQCQFAHSEAELKEWKDRYELSCKASTAVENDVTSLARCRMDLRLKLQNIKESSGNEKRILADLVSHHVVRCDGNLVVMHAEKNREIEWLFSVFCHKEGIGLQLKRVFLLHQDLPEFWLNMVFFGQSESIPCSKECQIWESDGSLDLTDSPIHFLVQFQSGNYGNFCQDVIFDFGREPMVVRRIAVQVACEADLVRAMDFKPNVIVEDELTWLSKYDIIPFQSRMHLKLEDIYKPLPPNIENLLYFGAYDHRTDELTIDNYRDRLHILLHLEEFERRKLLRRMSLHLDNFGIFASLYSENGNVSIPFDECYVEDLMRFVGKSGKALIRVNSYEQRGKAFTDSPLVYEAMLKEILNNRLIMDVPEPLLQTMKTSAIPVDVDICFRLVDVFQPMHYAIDNINLDLMFPRIPSNSCFRMQAQSSTGGYLSQEQLRALDVILEEQAHPPILLLGPFGAGKTRTIAKAVSELLHRCRGGETGIRILVCTHSNSAADHYIEEYFHPNHDVSHRSQEEIACYLPLRVNWEHRYQASVSDKVFAYCAFDRDTGLFAPPTRQVLDKYRLVICTTVTSECLHKLSLPEGYFSHIFIDEAAQAMEVEVLVPLLLAHKGTRVVLAGDHMQLGETIFSPVAEKLHLGRSLLERLFTSYPFDSPCKLQLLENFRSYWEIVNLSSILFYDNSLVSNKRKPSSDPYPVSFHGVHGAEVLSKVNPSYANAAEATEVWMRVANVVEQWKDQGRAANQSSICVVAFYAAQVRLIRQILRKNGFSEVRVESVNNIQGLEFDVLIVSTVRTYTAATLNDVVAPKDMGFLTKPKLLNTAFTRARHQVIIVGEPVALCSVGQCKACWKKILGSCHFNNTFNYRLDFKKVMGVIHDLEANHSSGSGSLRWANMDWEQVCPSVSPEIEESLTDGASDRPCHGSPAAERSSGHVREAVRVECDDDRRMSNIVQDQNDSACDETKVVIPIHDASPASRRVSIVLPACELPYKSGNELSIAVLPPYEGEEAPSEFPASSASGSSTRSHSLSSNSHMCSCCFEDASPAEDADTVQSDGNSVRKLSDQGHEPSCTRKLSDDPSGLRLNSNCLPCRRDSSCASAAPYSCANRSSSPPPSYEETKAEDLCQGNSVDQRYDSERGCRGNGFVRGRPPSPVSNEQLQPVCATLASAVTTRANNVSAYTSVLRCSSPSSIAPTVMPLLPIGRPVPFPGRIPAFMNGSAAYQFPANISHRSSFNGIHGSGLNHQRFQPLAGVVIPSRDHIAGLWPNVGAGIRAESVQMFMVGGTNPSQPLSVGGAEGVLSVVQRHCSAAKRIKAEQKFTEQYCRYLHSQSNNPSVVLPADVSDLLEEVSSKAEVIFKQSSEFHPDYVDDCIKNLERKLRYCYEVTGERYLAQATHIRGRVLSLDEALTSCKNLGNEMWALIMFVDNQIFVRNKPMAPSDIMESLQLMKFWLALIKCELGVCSELLQTQNQVSSLCFVKLKFVEQQIRSLQAKQKQFMERACKGPARRGGNAFHGINVVLSESGGDDLFNSICTNLSNQPQPASPVLHSFSETPDDGDLSFTSDADYSAWVRQRSSDPCTREYSTALLRRRAERLPGSEESLDSGKGTV